MTHRLQPFLQSAGSGALGAPRDRQDVPDAYKWNLADIFPDWTAWEAACAELETEIEQLPALQGTLGRGPERLLTALRTTDQLGQLAYKVYYYTALMHDEDQRSNEVNARKQRVQVLLAKLGPGDVVVQPGVAAHPGRDRARVDGRPRRTSRCTASRSRTSTGSRSTCSTRTASACCRSPTGSRARRTRPTRRCRRPTSSGRPSR